MMFSTTKTAGKWIDLNEVRLISQDLVNDWILSRRKERLKRRG
jgi:hypothetical protein